MISRGFRWLEAAGVCKRHLLELVCAALIVCNIGSNAWSAAAPVFYVSTKGNDKWAGTVADPTADGKNGPFASLARARDALRPLKTSGATVYVRGGTYQLTQPITFSPADSGYSTSAPTTYTAYPGEKPVISGGVQIAGWSPFAGSSMPAAAQGHVWVAPVPSNSSGPINFNQLFVNGTRRIRARTPNVGSYFYIAGNETAVGQAQFQYFTGNILSPWAAKGDVELITLQSWADTRMTITAVDASSRMVSLSGTFSQYYNEVNGRYWVENTIDALDSPGEWYLDKKAALVYYYPMPGEDLTKAQVIAPAVQQLVIFQGDAANNNFVSNISLSGFTFSYADWTMPPSVSQASYLVPAAVVGYGSHSCGVTNSLFTHLGGYAVDFEKGAQGNYVVGNEITEIGAGGVKIGDPDVPTSTNLQSVSNRVTDNHIHDIGKVFRSAVGIWVGESANNQVAHNEINDTYYTGISVGWTFNEGPSAASGNLIQHNNIHDIGRGMLSDMGCVYTLGTQIGTIVGNNVCHDVTRYYYGGWGIYTDLGSSNIVVQNNIVYRTDDGGYISGRANNITVQNNIFAFGKSAQIWLASPALVLNFRNNIFDWNQGTFIGGPYWYGAWQFDYNDYFCPGDCPTGASPTFSSYYSDWRLGGQDAHSTVADPLFVDPANGDFRIKVGSPATKLGFQQIDVTDIGPRAGYYQPLQ